MTREELLKMSKKDLKIQTVIYAFCIAIPCNGNRFS